MHNIFNTAIAATETGHFLTEQGMKHFVNAQMDTDFKQYDLLLMATNATKLRWYAIATANMETGRVQFPLKMLHLFQFQPISVIVDMHTQE